MRKLQTVHSAAAVLYHAGGGEGKVEKAGRYDGGVTSRVDVSGERLAGNYRVLAAIVEREVGAGAALLAVVKANAYGHGAGLCAPVLAEAGAEWLGVTDAEEGGRVRGALAAAGVAAERQPAILVMCGQMAGAAEMTVRHGLTPVMWRREQMEVLAAAASGGEPLQVHLEIDTGMSRQGMRVEELRELLGWLRREPRLWVDGVMTHFASAEVAGSAQTAGQRERFADAMGIVAEEGVRPRWVHAGNTSAIDNAADGGTLAWLGAMARSVGARAMVRAGLGLYGYCLPLEGLVASDGEGASRLGRRLRPVMRWTTRVAAISEVEAGARVGYGGTFVAERPMRLALLPVGYADGLRRELSGCDGRRGGWVMIRGERAAMVGRVSMNLSTVDVSGIAGAAVGDEVVVLGEGITAEDHAAVGGTIAYEILCGIRGGAVLVP